MSSSRPGRAPSRSGRRAALLGLLSLATATGLGLGQQGGSVSRQPGEAATLELGAEVFARSCAVCHGATGLGLAEAKEAFPESHRRCTHCHRPGNPSMMDLRQIEARQNDIFDIGEPPPLRGEAAMANEIGSDSLREYIQATMPRYAPGSLTADEYLAVTEFLLHLDEH